PAPSGHPQPDRFFVGDVPFVLGQPGVMARMQMGWVSPSLRRAVVEIDRVADTNTPLDNGAGVTWESVFRLAGWDVNAVDSDHNLTKTGPDPIWNTGDAETAMQEHRDNNDLDKEWRFYVLLVPQIRAIADSDGFMYHHNREALYVAAHSAFPDKPQFGTLR